MAKVDKKKKRLIERLETLETEMRDALTKKTSTTREINVPEQTRRITELRKEIAAFK